MPSFAALPAGLAERTVTHIRQGRPVRLPIGSNVHGHGAHTYGVAWKQYPAELLQEPAR